MEKEIIKPQMIIEERSGLKLLLDADKIDTFMQECEKKRFVCVGGEWLNTADIKGIFFPNTINERERTKSGNGTWHCDRHKNNIPFGKKCGYCESGTVPKL